MFKAPIFIHHKAEVEAGSTIGKGTKVWRWAHIRENAEIGDDCMIVAGCFIDSTVKIGSGSRLQNNVFVPRGVIIGKNVFIGPNTCFCNVKKPKADKRGKFEVTIIEDNAVIGANCTILPGITIGNGSVVGAGSVITKSLPAGEMAWGVPAKIQHYVWHQNKE